MIIIDWTGNAKSIFTCNGASNHSVDERQVDDYYATEPKAVELLLEQETFHPYIWECACGEGHMSEILKKHGYKVTSSDIIDRSYPGTKVIDFLKVTKSDLKPNIPMDIITNPPYKYAQEFIQHALDISMDGTKIAMFLKLTFLESQGRKQFFLENPFKTLYVSSSRLMCAKNGDFEKCAKNAPAVAYGWYVWVKGYKGDPIIKWIN